MPVTMIALKKGKHVELTLTPVKAIREKCLECAGTWLDVEKCEFSDCSLFPYRFDTKLPLKKGIRLLQSQTIPIERRAFQSNLTPVKAIKTFCRDYCMLENKYEPIQCTCPDCTLYPYRMGKRPND